MSSRITSTGLRLTGTSTNEQTKVITEIDGVTLSSAKWSNTGVVKLSSTNQSLDTRVTNLETRVTPLEESVSTGSLIPLPQWTMLLNTAFCPRIRYSGTTTDSNYYELDYDIFYSSLGLSPHPIPDRAILYVKITMTHSAWNTSSLYMTGYDRVFYSTSSTLNPPILAGEEQVVHETFTGDARTVCWSGYLFPTWGNPNSSNVEGNPSPSYRGRIGLTPQHPRKLAIRWTGNLYMTVLGYMMPNYTD